MSLRSLAKRVIDYTIEDEYKVYLNTSEDFCKVKYEDLILKNKKLDNQA